MSVHINTTGTLMLHVAVVLKGVCEVVLNCMLIRASQHLSSQLLQLYQW